MSGQSSRSLGGRGTVQPEGPQECRAQHPPARRLRRGLPIPVSRPRSEEVDGDSKQSRKAAQGRRRKPATRRRNWGDLPSPVSLSTAPPRPRHLRLPRGRPPLFPSLCLTAFPCALSTEACAVCRVRGAFSFINEYRAACGRTSSLGAALRCSSILSQSHSIHFDPCVSGVRAQHATSCAPDPPPPGFVNKVLLEHGPANLPRCLWLHCVFVAWQSLVYILFLNVFPLLLSDSTEVWLTCKQLRTFNVHKGLQSHGEDHRHVRSSPVSPTSSVIITVTVSATINREGVVRTCNGRPAVEAHFEPTHSTGRRAPGSQSASGIHYLTQMKLYIFLRSPPHAPSPQPPQPPPSSLFLWV